MTGGDDMIIDSLHLMDHAQAVAVTCMAIHACPSLFCARSK